MHDNKYIVLLNNSLKQHILTLGEKVKGRIKEKFEFLGNGLWDSGVKVKKLKGFSNSVIFEARVDRGDRIIFTLGRHNEKTAIYVWGITKHDNINKSASRVAPSNAPFLNFEPEAIEDYNEMLIDDLPDVYFTQEGPDEKYNDECGPQKWLVLKDEEWKRILLHNGKDDFEIFLFLTSEQENILREEPPALISGTAGSGKTTIAVYYLLKNNFLNKKRLFLTYNEYLRKFSKRLYHGLVIKAGIENPENQPDFYAFKDLLLEIAGNHNMEYDQRKEVGLKEFDRIFRNHHLYSKYDSELVWEEIRAIIKGAKPPISVGEYKRLLMKYSNNDLSETDINRLKDLFLNLRRFEFIIKIERIVQAKTRHKNLDSFIMSMEDRAELYSNAIRAVLSETLKVINKKNNSFSSPLLTFNEYNSLGKKRAPNFMYDRKDIYSIAEYYQKKLEEEQLWDEIDLCKEVIKIIDHNSNSLGYDLVVCDEVQDFTDIQIHLIFKLALDYRNILLAGDPKQIINPSGFRWEEVKSRFYERGAQSPDVFNLRLNFRSVGNIIKLSNALLDLKQRLIGLSSNEFREEWKFNGTPPVLIYNIKEQTILEKMRITGAGMIILVRDVIQQEKLKKTLGTELVFTINEAKGLEFDTVFIWQFINDEKSLDLWRKIKNEHLLEESHYPHIKHEINLFYVAITRARNTLIFYDGENPSDIWEIDNIRDHVYFNSEEDILSAIWQKTSTPEEWEEQGDYFSDRKYYSAAMECYKISGNKTKMEIAEAYNNEQEKKYIDAAELFEKNGFDNRAADNYELGEEYMKALPLRQRLNQKNKANICRVRLYEKKGEFNKAAEGWKKLNNPENALLNWEKAGNYQVIAKYHFSKKNYAEASRYFEMDSDYARAADSLKKLKNFEKAAHLYFKGGKYDEAIILYKRVKNSDREIGCYIKKKDYYNAALVCEKKKDFVNAIKYFTAFAEISKDNKNLLKEEAEKNIVRNKLKSAIRYTALKNYRKSAQIFFDRGDYSEAIEQYSLIDNKKMMAECYLKMSDYYNYAVTIENTELKDRYTLSEKGFDKYIYNNNLKYDRNKADALYKEAKLFHQQGSYDKALSRCKAINYPDMIHKIYMKIDKDDDAIRYYFKEVRLDLVKEFLNKKENLNISRELLKYISKNTNINRHWYGDKDLEKIDISSQLFLKGLELHDDKDSVSLAHSYINSLFDITYRLISNIPISFLKLLIELKRYNMLFICIRDAEDNEMEIIPELDQMLNMIKLKGEEGDQNFLACYYYLEDRQKFDEIITGIEVNRYNSELFTYSRHYQRAINYYLELKDFEMAISACDLNDQNRQAAEISEKSGDIVNAGKRYTHIKDYEAAVRCFLEAESFHKAAQVYEKMKNYDKAIEMWEIVNKPKHIARIKNKIQQEKQIEIGKIEAKSQLELFPDN